MLAALRETPPTPELVGASQELVAYFRDLAELRRAEPRDDLVSALVHAEVEGRRLHQHELDGFFVVLLVAGNETTTNLISNQLHILAARPDLWKRLREERQLVPQAIEETVRFDCPVKNLGRETTRDIVLRGVEMPAGSRVIVSYGAANRDPEALDAPDENRLERTESRHLGFGFGVHFCLGAGLARLEGQIALDALLDRFDAVEPGDAAPKRLHSTVIRGFESLPLWGRRGQPRSVVVAEAVFLRQLGNDQHLPRLLDRVRIGRERRHGAAGEDGILGLGEIHRAARLLG